MINEIMVLGVILSIAFYEITEISPGGLIVPAYFALYLDNPTKIILTIFISLLTFILLKILSNYAIIYGRRRFTVCIILSFLIKTLLKYLNIYILNENEIYFLNIAIVGIIIPGILAQEMDKNGAIRTLSSLFILSIFMKSLIEIFY
ncbi:poly-gamma-glutamate biosynthesis protein PgsC [Fusobacterium simiae]|uniref:Poly-gamma-glutamate biosynthesis protein PgsC n=1 Tax=Fusobacterium simiae TaxID=855 RepID=A0ABT4DJR2_FUSSI|nr:poly-gamma-glutamate biosynthesis protein PgsC [Fusobacterium simiae]MCY7008833.1 poly-gamma-glutamate biosynthesis protein PgsC [Fusobacterium simiae]